MSNIFISYRREDSIDIVGRIYDWLALRVPRESIFIDIDSIPAAVDFRAAVESAIASASIMLVVIGQRWLEISDGQGHRRLDDPDDFVRTEIQLAMQRNVPILPILVQNASMPSASAFPPELASLAYRNALPVRSGPDFTRDVERVANAIEVYVLGMASAAPAISSTKALLAPVSGAAALPVATGSVSNAPLSDEERRLLRWITMLGFSLFLITLIALVAAGVVNAGRYYCFSPENGCNTASDFVISFYGVMVVLGLPLALAATVLVGRHARQFERDADMVRELPAAIAVYVIGTILLGAVGLAGLMFLIYTIRQRRLAWQLVSSRM